MGRFLRENWLWIVVPIFVVLGLLVAYFFLMGDDSASTPFDYPIF